MRRLFVLTLLPSLFGVAGAAHARGDTIERIIAKVNGEIITLTDFQERQIAAAQQARVTPDQVGTFLRQNNARLLQEAIDEILLIQEADSLGLALPDDFIDDIIESIKKDNNIESEEQFQMALAQEGLTLDQLRERVRKSSTRRMIIQRNVEPKIAVSEEELKEHRRGGAELDPAALTRRLDELLAEAGVRRRNRKARIDQAAATLILQGYLDARRSGAQVDAGTP